jgi:hypothetical protein
VCVPGAATDCAPYHCSAGVCFTDCAGDADCVAPNRCHGGVCGLGAAGDDCSSADSCASGHCVNGVCCGSASCPSCQACNVPGARGTCHAVAAGAPDPANACQIQPTSSCGFDGACDGAGGCRHYALGTVCAAATCNRGTITLAHTCDGQGNCVDRGTMSCAPYDCGGSPPSCRTTCTNTQQCCCGARCNDNTSQCM